MCLEQSVSQYGDMAVGMATWQSVWRYGSRYGEMAISYTYELIHRLRVVGPYRPRSALRLEQPTELWQ